MSYALYRMTMLLMTLGDL